jgi:hypothetical protein
MNDQTPTHDGLPDICGPEKTLLGTSRTDVMMNEFPAKYREVIRECSGSETPILNGSEYLEYLAGLGIQEKDLPTLQPFFQKRIWDRFRPGSGPEQLAKVIEQLKREDSRFHTEGGSWTNNISWVKRK